MVGSCHMFQFFIYMYILSKDNTYSQANVIPINNGFCSLCEDELYIENNELKCNLCGKKGSDVSQIKYNDQYYFNVATIKWV